jgi:aryl-alcohol dehydrogenase-like predicted oxidoreductase
VAVVRRALDLGITYVDTARAYGTEEIVGEALAGRRDEVVLSTKAPVRAELLQGELTTGETLRRSLERSLRALRTDAVDVFHLHSVLPEDYDYCAAELAPAMEELRRDGLIRCAAVSEVWIRDVDHTVMRRAVDDDLWGLVMVGFNFFNHNARDTVLDAARRQRTAVAVMYAARGYLSHPDMLEEKLVELVDEGYADVPVEHRDHPVDYLLDGSGAASLSELAYRYCRHTPGADVILTGTGNIAHLEENVRAIAAPPLPDATLERLDRTFAGVTHLCGDIPSWTDRLREQLRDVRADAASGEAPEGERA